MLQLPERSGKLREDPPEIWGAPNSPVPLRVSAIRQGVIGTKRNAAGAAMMTVESLAFALGEPPPETATEFVSGEEALVSTLTVTVMG